MQDIDKIYEMAQGVDNYLRRLEEILPIMRDIQHSLRQIIQAQQAEPLFDAQRMQADVSYLASQLRHGLPPDLNRYEREFADIRELLATPAWPEALPESQICRTEEQERQRGQAILDLVIAEQFKNKRFLNYYAENDIVANLALQQEAEVAITYHPTAGVTNDWQEVKRQGPYDIILLYDALDHLVDTDPVQLLYELGTLLSNRGRIFLTNHPWSARHGGHTYLAKNKAFLHLILDDIELARLMGNVSKPNLKILKPLETYRSWYQRAGLTVVTEIPSYDTAEPFFIKHISLHDRLRKYWNSDEIMLETMSISTVQYILERSNHHIL